MAKFLYDHVVQACLSSLTKCNTTLTVTTPFSQNWPTYCMVFFLLGFVTLQAGPQKLRRWVVVFASHLSYHTLMAAASPGLKLTITWPANHPIKPLKQRHIPRFLTKTNQTLNISQKPLSSPRARAAAVSPGLKQTITWPPNLPIKPLKRHQRQCHIPRFLTAMNQPLGISQKAPSSPWVWTGRAWAELTAWWIWLLQHVKDVILLDPGYLWFHFV